MEVPGSSVEAGQKPFGMTLETNPAAVPGAISIAVDGSGPGNRVGWRKTIEIVRSGSRTSSARRKRPPRASWVSINMSAGASTPRRSGRL
jgi:hypothetical protein